MKKKPRFLFNKVLNLKWLIECFPQIPSEKYVIQLTTWGECRYDEDVMIMKTRMDCIYY
jgi:hypothetical protein